MGASTAAPIAPGPPRTPARSRTDPTRAERSEPQLAPRAVAEPSRTRRGVGPARTPSVEVRGSNLRFASRRGSAAQSGDQQLLALLSALAALALGLAEEVGQLGVTCPLGVLG